MGIRRGEREPICNNVKEKVISFSHVGSERQITNGSSTVLSSVTATPCGISLFPVEVVLLLKATDLLTEEVNYVEKNSNPPNLLLQLRIITYIPLLLVILRFLIFPSNFFCSNVSLPAFSVEEPCIQQKSSGELNQRFYPKMKSRVMTYDLTDCAI